MDWVFFKLVLGIVNDIMIKDVVVDCFKVYYCGVLVEWDWQCFLLLFGQIVVGKGLFLFVMVKKKIVVGLKVKEFIIEFIFESGSENKSLI